MFRNYIKIAFRSLLKNKSYVIINTLGMGTAIATCIIAYLNYDFNNKFDRDQEHFDEIYHVVSVRDYNDGEQPYGITPLKFSEFMDPETSAIDEIVRIIPAYGSVKIKEEVLETNILFADPSVFNVFSFEILKGGIRDFEGPEIVITEEAALKYFGNSDPIGQTVEHIVDDQPKPYTVIAVIKDLPENSSLEFVEAIAPMDNYRYVVKDLYDQMWNYWSTTFVRLKDPSKMALVEAEMNKIIPEQNEAREDFKLLRFELMPLDGMADRGQNSEIWSMWLTRGVPAAAIVGPMVMALLLMLLACFNYTNTSIAMSGRRLKEIGLRKVMGGLRKQLMFQFILENMVLCLFALFVGIMIAELIIPYYNSMWDFVTLRIDYLENRDLLLFMFILILLVGLIAGSYPSYFVSSFEATPILRGTVKFGGNTVLSKVLLSLQLSISLIAIVAAFVFIHNAKFQENFDLGFNRDQIIYTYVNNGQEYENLSNALRSYEEIDQIAGTEQHILSYTGGMTIDLNDEEYQVEAYRVGHDYFDIMDIEVLEGRGFREDSETDMNESVVANEMFLKEFNIQNPIGQRIMWNDSVSLYIVGVVENTFTNALWGPVEPILFRPAKKEDFQRIVLKTSPENMIKAHEILGEEYSKLFPFRIYNGVYMNDEMAEEKVVNRNIVTIFTFLGVVALILSVTGLYAMISLNLLKRTKEIGVRKVVGASVPSLIMKLNKPFMIIVLASVVLGCVTSYFLVDGLLSMIWEHYASPNAGSMFIGSLILVVVALVTVTGKVFKAASVNPVESLRSE
ncbi:ABC transporter permease [Fulvivirga sedimenti]|uniref:ABC transporter permease n=1 Tax=Fulvivirga sedimenti TaxID=2879465 RepID=A0A9X1HVY9_9BACT|nr:ABC transporter permease [Fulvivirga sedimenti]MCA6075184.1 ABC transporter permease [Fulvivirga sedimenti]MCA6076361.1 ABC transporter permease [Fulvivirga sedimenti]MCA6077489.1 ABC transporter permease [Fulvivirga sedimenti]